MKKLMVLMFSALMVNFAQAAEYKSVTIRCSTNYNNGNYSIFIGTLTVDGLTGNLSRGLNSVELGAAKSIFAISVLGGPSTTNGILNFQLNADLRMSTPYEQIGWENPNFTVSRSLLVSQIRSGGMIEEGTTYTAESRVPYKLIYKCVSL